MGHGRSVRQLSEALPCRVQVLGVGVDPISADELVPRVAALVEQGDEATVTYANVHVLNQARKDQSLSDFLARASLVYCDGNGVRLGARMLGESLPDRMTGADWIWDLAAQAEGRWRLYWIGGEPGVTAAAAQALQARHPRLAIETDHGFHPRTGPEDAACIRRINSYGPDIVLVGMGTPEQETWVKDRREQLDAPVVWCLGATADFIAGRTARGPQWLTDNAEWLARLAAEPRRLWHRYLVGNSVFLARVLRERWL
jgi:N-acetylglucosaminyldiphosphoundecaprenol N-acetyl-beta-D-mannosaminyltransferase